MNIQFERYFTQGLIENIESNSQTILPPDTVKKTKDKLIILCKTIKNVSSHTRQCIVCLDHFNNATVCKLFCCGLHIHESCLEKLINKEYTKRCIVCDLLLPAIEILKSKSTSSD